MPEQLPTSSIISMSYIVRCLILSASKGLPLLLKYSILSFNSNFIGFKNAIKSLSLSGTYNILITPGLVEQDAVLNEYYKELSIMIKSAVDEVYLINNKSIKLLLKYFDDIKFKKYIVVESFKDAINLINKKNIDIFYTILIENDLTDYYLNRG